MGNCLEKCGESILGGKEEGEEGQRAGGKAEEDNESHGFQKEGALRVKILLSREELERLLLQLQEKGGKRSLEDVLLEMESGRERAVAESWKPSLESIMETPEVQTLEMVR